MSRLQIIVEYAIESTCPQCKETFTHKRYRKRTYCSNSCTMKARTRRPEDHPRYKGEDGNTDATHRWVTRVSGGKPKVCDFCHENPGKAKDGRTLLEWSNISGQYRRVLSDWQCLCAKCHRNFDKGYLKRQRNEKGAFI